jgi:hypothetical protein
MGPGHAPSPAVATRYMSSHATTVSTPLLILVRFSYITEPCLKPSRSIDLVQILFAVCDLRGRSEISEPYRFQSNILHDSITLFLIYSDLE